MKKFILSLFFVLFLINLFLIMFSHYSLRNNISENRLLQKDLNKLKNEIDQVHLWTEEYAIGDKKIDVKNSIFKKLELQIGKYSNYSDIEDKTLNKLIEKIKTGIISFYKDTKKRINKKTIAGSKDDEIYDNLFNNLTLDINNATLHLSNKMNRKFETNSIYFYFSVILFIIINIFSLLTIFYLVKKEERDNKKIAQQLKLNSLDEMLKNIAHQWRQPLSTISTAASGLKLKREFEGQNSDKSVDETLDIIIKSTMYLSKTIDDFSNCIKNSKAIDKLPVNTIIEKSLKIMEEQVKFNHIEVIKNLDNNIDNKKYKSELIQVITNILNNSKDELEKVEGEKYIFIDTKEHKNKFIIEIKDNGGGIDEKIIDKIFDPYFTTKHQTYGTGLGLSMCVKILETLNGKIEVENVEFKLDKKSYKGALFRIFL